MSFQNQPHERTKQTPKSRIQHLTKIVVKRFGSIMSEINPNQADISTGQLSVQMQELVRENQRIKETLSQVTKNLSMDAQKVAVIEKPAKIDVPKKELSEDKTQLEINMLRSECESLKASLRKIQEERSQILAESSKKQQLVSQLQDLNNQAGDLNKKLQSESYSLRNQLNAAQSRTRSMELALHKSKLTLSFQLGYILLHCFKSFVNFRRLPKQLWSLRQEATRRRSTREHLSVIPSIESYRTLALPPVQANSKVASTPSVSPPVINRLQEKHQNLVVGKTKDIRPTTLESIKKLRVAGIFDEFTESSFYPECDLFQITPNNWQSELAAFKPELLFIESAWRGKNELWKNSVHKNNPDLLAILDWCKKSSVPTAFWNKEDPVHFDTFINTASRFNFVFTTDIDCIPRYKQRLGHDNVFLLPFACQPKFNNPIARFARQDAFCFAGAYYARYPDRNANLDDLVSELGRLKPFEIYDRNFGKNEPDYMFPEKYNGLIVGNLPYSEIQKAYKGYKYAINMNSVKHSQSMFARRVYELLASNTTIISNFSRGVKLFFGDLVISSDDASYVAKEITNLEKSNQTARKTRLQGLRKVMQEHTYEARLAFICNKVFKTNIDCIPSILVVGRVSNDAQVDSILASFERQNHTKKRLLLICTGNLSLGNRTQTDVQVVSESSLNSQKIQKYAKYDEYIALFDAGDYYGSNYLVDLSLGFNYSETTVVGKASYFESSQHPEVHMSENLEYGLIDYLPKRCSLAKAGPLADQSILTWLNQDNSKSVGSRDYLSLDSFNYLKNGSLQPNKELELLISDLEEINCGVSLNKLHSLVENVRFDPNATLTTKADLKVLGKELPEYFKSSPKTPSIQFTGSDSGLYIESSLPSEKHEYFHPQRNWSISEVTTSEKLDVLVETSAGLGIQIAAIFLDKDGKRLNHAMFSPNKHTTIDIPPAAQKVQISLRISGTGTSTLKGIFFGAEAEKNRRLFGTAKNLILTNSYPSRKDRYRNGFVHRRALKYKEAGASVDLFSFGRGTVNEPFYDHEGIEVMTGTAAELRSLLENHSYQSILVHFLDEEMWAVLKDHVASTRIFVFLHGAEIQAWHRRVESYDASADMEKVKAESAKKSQFWKELINKAYSNLKFVFVSQQFADECFEDLNLRIPDAKYTIIHNPIDTNLFNYVEKSPEQRFKILMIRPFANGKYANELAVKAILRLSQHEIFDQLEFKIIGDGKLFDDIVSPLYGIRNISIEKRFLSQDEIATYHKQYGIFLVPTRTDSQGVSRDEAMSSGLIPITNRIAAIPEFVDSRSGMLVDPEDWEGMADAIITLVNDPARFMEMSRQAMLRVRAQTSDEVIIAKEISLANMK